MAFSFIQAPNPVTNTTASLPITFGSNNGLNNLLIAWVFLQGVTAFSSLTDSQGNTWVQAGTYQTDPGDTGLGLYYVAQSKAGANTVTLATTGTVRSDLHVLEFSGGAVSNPFDVSAGYTNAGGQFNVGPVGPITPAAAGELLIQGVGQSSGTTWTQGAGFTLSVANSNYSIMSQYQLSGAAGSQTASMTDGTNSQFFASIFAAFKAGAATVYSEPDCRVAPFGPNSSRTVQSTKIYDVQTSSNSTIPSPDSRAAGAPVDSRVAAIIPQNSRTPGTFGPGE